MPDIILLLAVDLVDPRWGALELFIGEDPFLRCGRYDRVWEAGDAVLRRCWGCGGFHLVVWERARAKVHAREVDVGEKRDEGDREGEER
jgi:hypothetical protein